MSEILRRADDALASASQEIAQAERLVDEADRSLPKIACPHCGHFYSRVCNSRGLVADGAVRRRRECSQCGSRYSTAERIIVGSLVQKSA